MTLIKGLDDKIKVKSGPNTTEVIDLVAINNSDTYEGYHFDGDRDSRMRKLKDQEKSLEFAKNSLEIIESQYDVLFKDEDESKVINKLKEDLSDIENKLDELGLSEDEIKLAEKYNTEKESLMKNPSSKLYLDVIEKAQKDYKNAFPELLNLGNGMIAFINRVQFIQRINLSKEQKDFLKFKNDIKKLQEYLDVPYKLEKAKNNVKSLEAMFKSTQNAVEKENEKRSYEVDLAVLKNKIKDVLEDFKNGKISNDEDVKSKIEELKKEYETKRNSTKRQ
jgi:hypothetical protein